ncbi:hypothetical protein SLW73_12085 [Glutamicibacter protophormiae]|uniref:PP2C family protein-serine/threonine phosphatase n=1 Tax=Glutamicibacter protophormiae TaxID=37930 RepID=UPI002A7EAE7F|nr:hypothetical protein [Glutamicibacter protophormiae]WPR63623.1 hypothetical protein SLW72_12090 [Glutamicibacter protophormiae]WPR67118.1 hypothetical protein SLW73_12085 [Glutamicibacter protophormiae]
MTQTGLSEDQEPTAMRISFAARTNVGLIRTRCEDALQIGQWIGLGDGAALSGTRTIAGGRCLDMTVVDGMGGHVGGADAAAVVAMELVGISSVPEQELGRALERISDRVLAAGTAWGTPDMGATFATLRIAREGIMVFNLGDCQVARCVSGRFGALTVEDRAADPFATERSYLTQSLGGAARALDPHAMSLPHGRGTTRYLVSSDGVHHELDEVQLVASVLHGGPTDALEALTVAVLATGARDNFTAIVVDVMLPEAPGTEPGLMFQKYFR